MQKHLADARSVVENAEVMDEAKEAEYRKHINDVQSVKKFIEKENELRELESLKIPSSDPVIPATRSEAKPEGEKKPEVKKSLTKEQRNAYFKAVGLRQEIPAEIRATMQSGVPLLGGDAFPDQQFVNDLFDEIRDMVKIRQKARILKLSKAKQIDIPVKSKKFDNPQHVTELTTGNEVNMEFDRVSLIPQPISSYAIISRDLLMDTLFDIDSEIRKEFAESFAEQMEQEYMNGDGTLNRSVGLFNAAFATTDVQTANAGALELDDFINLRLQLREQYRGNTMLIMHPDREAEVMKLKDNDGQYLWKMSTKESEPSTLWGMPVMTSYFAPDGTATGDYAAIYGDLSSYYIAEEHSFELRRADELHIQQNSVGYYARYRHVGKPLKPYKFSRLVFS